MYPERRNIPPKRDLNRLLLFSQE